MKKNSLLCKNFATFLLVFFNVAFPKGGIKFSGIPITWGVLCLSILGTALFIKKLSKFDFSVNKERCVILITWIPFQILCLVFFFENGVSNYGMMISFIFNLICVPWIILWNCGDIFDKMDTSFFFELMRKSIIFVSLYGIFLFIYKFTFGEFIEIPFLTVNYDDVGMLEDKYINRGGIFKLISTYNNGNIYGVCMLMLLPMFCFLEKNKIWQWVLKLSLLLTLSRTVWIGMIIYELINGILIKFTSKNLIALIVIFGIFIIGMLAMLNLMGADLTFIFDPNLGGRLAQIQMEAQFTPGIEFSGMSEIVYAGILYNFGVVGLILYILSMISPLMVYLFKREKDYIQERAFWGYIIYLIIAMSDGCMLYIPTMIIFWFLVLVLSSSKKI